MIIDEVPQREKMRFRDHILPTFIIIGTMKGGTSSLYQYLKVHPEISMSTEKETDFFISEKNFGKGIDWYTSQFKGEAKVYGEASPNYTKAQLFGGVPQRIHGVIPDVKLIYALRDPLERIVSHYVHNYAHGRESRSIAEALSTLDENHYVMTSMYYSQLSAYLPYFPEENLFVIASEDLRSATRKTLRSIFSFLGVDTTFDSDTFTSEFHASSGKKRRSALDRRIPSSRIRRALRPFLPASITNAVPFDKPSLDELTKVRLSEYLSPDIERLRAFTGHRFSDWSL